MLRILCLLLVPLAVAGDVVVKSTNSGPERLLIFIPGGKVPAENYKLTAEAIVTAATGLNLTVVVPSVFKDLCIISCFSTYACSSLKSTIDTAVAKSGFISTNPKEDTFVAGHSLGATCGSNLVVGYSYNYAGLLEFGGYTDKDGETSVANYSIPVLTMAGELDGGGARPGKLALYYEQFKEYATKHGEDKALTLKPVHSLLGVDHSNFCPGFFVTATKDLCAEVSQDEGLQAIGKASAAFLHLNSPTTSSVKAAALATMHEMLDVSRKLFEPYLEAFEYERGGSWCKLAQRSISGLSKEDAGKLQVEMEVVPFKGFQHGHTKYSPVEGGGLKVTDIASYEEAGGFGPYDIHGAAKSIDCKMVGGDRIAEQMQVKTNLNTTCGAMNRLAVETALELLPEKSKKRYLAQTRRVCYGEDKFVFQNIGPLFVKGSITVKETEACLEVASLALISTLAQAIYPGSHYCKLLSPAMALEWMMTDGLKPFPYDLTAESCKKKGGFQEIVV